MNERIKDLAITGGIYDCICDPYDKLKNGDPYSSVMVDLERFAELIVRECIEVFSKDMPDPTSPDYKLGSLNEVVDRVCNVAEHFGVKE
jgi:hypothetical protein